MTIRIFALGFACLLLSACTEQDWNHALTYMGLNDQPQTPPRTMGARAPQPEPRNAMARPMTPPANPAPVREAQAPKLNHFCEAVAQQDSQSSDFDAPTQQRVFIRSYQQCVAIFGDVTQ